MIGAAIERFFLRRFHLDELPQTLLTFGFLFIFADLSLWIWGGDPLMLTMPQIFAALACRWAITPIRSTGCF